MKILGININLTREDVLRVGGILLIMALVGNYGGATQHSNLVWQAVIPVTLLIMSMGIYYTIKTKRQWGGKMGRFLDLQAAAMTLLTWMWLLTVVVNAEIELLGLSPEYWTSYMYTAGGAGFIIAAYSFYLLNTQEFV